MQSLQDIVTTFEKGISVTKSQLHNTIFQPKGSSETASLTENKQLYKSENKANKSLV